MNNITLFLEKYIGAFFVFMIGISLKIRVYGKVPKGNVIFAFWHRNMLPLLYFRRNEGVVILISSSKDGELIAGPAKVLGFLTARGSSTRGSLAALRRMKELSQKHSLAITPDGPKGPPKKIKEGTLYASYLTKLPIIPVDVDIEKEFVFNSWDKFRLPKLFSKVNIRYGEEISIKNKEEITEKKEYLEKIMYELEKINKVRK